MLFDWSYTILLTLLTIKAFIDLYSTALNVSQQKKQNNIVEISSSDDLYDWED